MRERIVIRDEDLIKRELDTQMKDASELAVFIVQESKKRIPRDTNSLRAAGIIKRVARDKIQVWFGSPSGDKPIDEQSAYQDSLDLNHLPDLGSMTKFFEKNAAAYIEKYLHRYAVIERKGTAEWVATLEQRTRYAYGLHLAIDTGRTIKKVLNFVEQGYAAAKKLLRYE